MQYHCSAIPQKLPPTQKDGAELIDKEKIKHRLIILNTDGDIEKLSVKFENYIVSHPDYLASLEYVNSTKYGEYLAIINMAFKVIYKLRNEYSFEKHGMKYTDLPHNYQIKIRKKYPMRITQSNPDVD